MSWKAKRHYLKRLYRRRKHHMPHKQGRNYHHLLPSSKGGNNDVSNLLLIKIEKHKAFNVLFGPTCTAEKALSILQRVVRAKQYQSNA